MRKGWGLQLGAQQPRQQQKSARAAADNVSSKIPGADGLVVIWTSTRSALRRFPDGRSTRDDSGSDAPPPLLFLPSFSRPLVMLTRESMLLCREMWWRKCLTKDLRGGDDIGVDAGVGEGRGGAEQATWTACQAGGRTRAGGCLTDAREVSGASTRDSREAA